MKKALTLLTLVLIGLLSACGLVRQKTPEPPVQKTYLHTSSTTSGNGQIEHRSAVMLYNPGPQIYKVVDPEVPADQVEYVLGVIDEKGTLGYGPATSNLQYPGSVRVVLNPLLFISTSSEPCLTMCNVGEPSMIHDKGIRADPPIIDQYVNVIQGETYLDVHYETVSYTTPDGVTTSTCLPMPMLCEQSITLVPRAPSNRQVGGQGHVIMKIR